MHFAVFVKTAILPVVCGAAVVVVRAVVQVGLVVVAATDGLVPEMLPPPCEKRIFTLCDLQLGVLYNVLYTNNLDVILTISGVYLFIVNISWSISLTHSARIPTVISRVALL